MWLGRYQNALQKANYASLALKQEQDQAAAASADAEAEAEEELQVCHRFLITQQAGSFLKVMPRAKSQGKHDVLLMGEHRSARFGGSGRWLQPAYVLHWLA